MRVGLVAVVMTAVLLFGTVSSALAMVVPGHGEVLSPQVSSPDDTTPQTKIRPQGFLDKLLMKAIEQVVVTVLVDEYTRNKEYIHRRVRQGIANIHGWFIAWMADSKIDGKAKDMCNTWTDFWPEQPVSCGAYDL